MDMPRSLTLSELGPLIAQVDEMLLAVLERRFSLVRQVAESKEIDAVKIVRLSTESDRVNKIMELAEKYGINANFAASLLYFIIDESCKIQLQQLQDETRPKPKRSEEMDDAWYAAKKQTLLELTAAFALNYDERYHDKAGFALRSYQAYEQKCLLESFNHLPNQLAVDLGCATGLMSFFLAKRFKQVKAYDLSPTMIEVAQMNAEDRKNHNISFEVVDFENGIPLKDESVSLVVCNLGTASDFRDIKGVIREIERVLQPHGGAFLSFYNSEALIYDFPFIPWPVSLNAVINRPKNCLEVKLNGARSYLVYARAYSQDEVTDLFSPKFVISRINTFPTVSGLLPEYTLNDQLKAHMGKIDTSLENSPYGSYITVLVTKTF
ncbi:MAG: methyltransferase domain-containing protein [Candidatus Parcubacteria bacterium]|nr:methyltransferase domain-containing protein [Candidatus Parcubacteria bacterium]